MVKICIEFEKESSNLRNLFFIAYYSREFKAFSYSLYVSSGK
jgi:hypothetical protein